MFLKHKVEGSIHHYKLDKGLETIYTNNIGSLKNYSLEGFFRLKRRKMEIKKHAEIIVNKFDEASANTFRTQLFEAASDPYQPIIIHIDSYGGSVDALAKMIETMDSIPNHVITSCVGKAMSCGAVLLSHGDTRFLGRHSRVMIHEVSSIVAGDIHNMKNDVKEVEKLNKYFTGLLAKNCGLSGYNALRAIIKQRDGRDLYLRGSAAVKFGVVDFIGQPSVTTELKHIITHSQLKPLKGGKQ